MSPNAHLPGRRLSWDGRTSQLDVAAEEFGGDAKVVAVKILVSLGLSVCSFLFACLLWLAIVGMSEMLSVELPSWFSRGIIRLFAITISGMTLVVWLALNFVMWGRIWFEVSGPANVPHWALVLFSDGK